MASAAFLDPPTGPIATLRHLGPGLLVAATVVGSGELIATTKTGAQAGISFLWLIILGCFIKVFVQVELGRYAISSGEATLRALDRIPGPRLRANWIVWLWFALMPAAFVIMGGVVGGVGQALAIAIPVRGDYIAGLASLEVMGVATFDDRFWSAVIAVGTALLLVVGRYRLIERVAIGLVALFTVMTVCNVVMLQASPYRLSAGEIVAGLSFQLPELPGAWFTALATFGIIGVGAVDLIAYPYWCLEKGYGRHAGPNDGTVAWLARTRGWIRVMRIDALVSVAICTVATVAFYFIGAAVLHPQGLDPDGARMISTLIAAYEPVFGVYAKWLLLLGAVAVLYSSFLIATAAAARLLTDGLIIIGALADNDLKVQDRSVAWLSFALPLVAMLFFLIGWNPTLMILIGGLAQTILLPVIGFASIYFRFRYTDARLAPSRAWDVALMLSCLGFVVIGGFGLYRSF
jgi:Mn2+/Fe2+ NRAMP family transporter